VLLPHMVCDALVACGRLSGAGQQAMCPGGGKLCNKEFSSIQLVYFSTIIQLCTDKHSSNSQTKLY